MGDNHTVIAEQGAIRGTIHGAEDVVVFGYVEGKITLDGTLFVEPSGIVKATIDAQHIVVSGVIVGDVNGRECIEVSETGRVVGNLRTPRLVMAAGGAIRGRVAMDTPAGVVTAPVESPDTGAAGRTAPPQRAVAPPRPAPAPARPAEEPQWRRPTVQMPAAAAAPARTAPAPAPMAAPVAAPAPPPVAPPPAVAHVPVAPPPAAPSAEPFSAPPARPSRRRFEDLDTLFPVIPESSMDAWAVSVPSSDDRDDGPKER